MIINILDMMRQGNAVIEAEDDAVELNKIGNLRAGDTGIKASNGDVAANCHRRAFLRSKGIKYEKISDDRSIMFAAGKINEKIWLDRLRRVWKDHIKTEEDIATIWNTKNGIKVTGRPDIVLCKDAVPVLGLELKMVSSLYTAKSVKFEVDPKIAHLVQSAHYMWQLDIPFKLCYTQYVDAAIMWWAKARGKLMADEYPKPGELGSEVIAYNPRGKPKKVLPFYLAYDLRFTDKGELQYSLEGEDAWISTIISIDDIKRYYEFISTMEEKKELGARPRTVKSDGKAEYYNICDYCALKPVCDAHDTWSLTLDKESSFDTWLQTISSLNSSERKH